MLCTYVCKYMIVVVFQVVFEYIAYAAYKMFMGNGRNNCILTNCLFNRQRSESGRSIRIEVKKRKTCSEHITSLSVPYKKM